MFINSFWQFANKIAALYSTNDLYIHNAKYSCMSHVPNIASFTWPKNFIWKFFNKNTYSCSEFFYRFDYWTTFRYIRYWLSERSVQEEPSRRRGPQTSEKRTRPVVSSCMDRTSSVNKLFIILWQKQKQFCGDIANFFDVCFVLNLFHVVLKHYLLPDNEKHLDSPHSQTFQTLKPFHKTEFSDINWNLSKIFPPNLSGPYCWFPTAQEPIKMLYFGGWPAREDLPYNKSSYWIVGGQRISSVQGNKKCGRLVNWEIIKVN